MNIPLHPLYIFIGLCNPLVRERMKKGGANEVKWERKWRVRAAGCDSKDSSYGVGKVSVRRRGKGREGEWKERGGIGYGSFGGEANILVLRMENERDAGPGEKSFPQL